MQRVPRLTTRVVYETADGRATDRDVHAVFEIPEASHYAVRSTKLLDALLRLKSWSSGTAYALEHGRYDWNRDLVYVNLGDHGRWLLGQITVWRED